MTEGRYNYARDGFIYLLSYATLLISSVAFNFLLKALVNKYLPDAVEAGEWLADDTSIIGFLAAVVIAFPIFVYLNYSANKMLGENKMKHDSGVRNWLLYITLTVVILIIIYQVVALFIAYLSGVLVWRFALHSLITLAIAAAVLWYQWWHLKFFRGDKKPLGKMFKIFEWKIFILVLAVVVWAFAVIDSPAQRRLDRLDSMRVQRLATIRDSVQNFYGWKGEGSGNGYLPQDLDELITDTRVYLSRDEISDPATKEEFGYRVLGAKSYELCAVFDTEELKPTNGVSRDIYIERPLQGRDEVFGHGVGEECFQLSVE